MMKRKKGSTTEREYWYIHEETLWRFGLQKGIITSKWGLKGLFFGKSLGGEIKKEKLSEVTRQQILDKILEKAEEKGCIVHFSKAVKRANHPTYKNIKDNPRYVSYEETGKLVEATGTLHFTGEFKNNREEMIGSFIPISISPFSIPALLHFPSILEDVRIPPVDYWKNLYITIVGAITIQHGLPLVKIIVVYRDSEKLKNSFKNFILRNVEYEFPEDIREAIDEEKMKQISMLVTQHILKQLANTGWNSVKVPVDELDTYLQYLDKVGHIIECNLAKKAPPEEEAKKVIEENIIEDFTLDVTRAYYSELLELELKMKSMDSKDFFTTLLEIVGISYKEGLNRLNYMIKEANEEIKLLEEQ